MPGNICRMITFSKSANCGVLASYEIHNPKTKAIDEKTFKLEQSQHFYDELYKLRWELLRADLKGDVEDLADEYEFLSSTKHFCFGTAVTDVKFEKVFAYARIHKIDDNLLQIRHLCVMKQSQNRTYARQVISHLLAYASTLKPLEVVLHSRSNVVSFWQKFGFEVTGSEYNYLGIKHLPMRKLYDS